MITQLKDSKNGCLVLIPTPIDEEYPLEGTALWMLHEISASGLTNSDTKIPKYILLVEDHKVARRRWLRWGLPREAIDSFRLLNEHSSDEEIKELAILASQGCKIFLMSDCGLPAIFDPGQQLVDQCLDLGVRVTATPFPNSVLLALALSGFVCAPHYTLGFLPRAEQERTTLLNSTLRQMPCSIIFMDTPYRYGKILAALSQLHKDSPTITRDRQIFIGKNLNQKEEHCLRISFHELSSILAKETQEKPEFVIVIGPTLSAQAVR